MRTFPVRVAVRKDKGNGFEDGCAGARSPVPAALVHLWGFCKNG